MYIFFKKKKPSFKIQKSFCKYTKGDIPTIKNNKKNVFLINVRLN